MKKFRIPGILAAFVLFLSARSQAAPIDVPYKILVSTTNSSGLLVISTTNFPSANANVNSLVGSYQWCIDRMTISCASADNFSIYWTTAAVTAGTTDYMVTTAAGVPFDGDVGYREPYCAPVGASVVTLKSSVAASTITVEGYLWNGWNP